MRPRARGLRAVSRLAALIVTVAVGCGLAGCTGSGSSPSPVLTSACPQNCEQIAALVASGAKQCPDLETFASTVCRAWASKISSVYDNWFRTQPQTISSDAFSALGELEDFYRTCARKAQVARADVLGGCQAELIRGIIDFRLARAARGGSRPPGKPVSDVDYQWALGLAMVPVSSALAKLRHASTSAQVSAGLVVAEAAAQAASGVLLRTVSARPAASRAQRELVTALDGWLTQIKTADPGAGSCRAAAPALGGLSAAGGTAYTRDLPKAFRAMAAAGFPVPLVLPALPGQYNRRLGNGTRLLDVATGGLGELDIDGSGVSDAVVELVARGRPVVKVYIQAENGVQFHDIRDGSYTVYVGTGADWDSTAKSFTRGCRYQRLDPPLDFHTTAAESTVLIVGIEGTPAGSLTITPVPGFPGEA